MRPVNRDRGPTDNNSLPLEACVGLVMVRLLVKRAAVVDCAKRQPSAATNTLMPPNHDDKNKGRRQTPEIFISELQIGTGRVISDF